MKKPNINNFKAKNGKEFYFELTFQENNENEFINFLIKSFDIENKNLAGQFIISLSLKDKYNKLYTTEIDNILFYNNNIDDSGIDFDYNNLPYVISQFDFENLCHDISLEGKVYNIKKEEELKDFLTELSIYIEPEKKVIESNLNKAFIANVYCEEEYQGIGLGKKLYHIAAEWMTINNLKLYTQNIRTEHAQKIWNSIKNDDNFIYSKDNNLDCVEIRQKQKIKPKI